jgi:thiosulfate dehydrogenase (quinone) large subunit
MTKDLEFSEPPFARFLFGSTKMAGFWLLVRLYVGWAWLHAGWEKFQSAAWVGDKAGTAIKGFLMGALQKTSGAHPDVQGWYASFIQNVALPNAETLSYIITFGEIAIGIALILGLFTGIAAFFGTFMNLNFLLAGTVSINPILLLLQLFLILAWRIAGWYGLDRYVLPALGTPWQAGHLFRNSRTN